MTTLMKSPAGSAFSKIFFRDGSVGAIDASGYIAVPVAFVSDMLNAGFTPIVPAGFTSETTTAITTAGAGLLTAAALEKGVIVRSGALAAFTDTTDTAADIIAAQPDVIVGSTWELTLRNTTAFVDTLAGGVGVTLAGITKISANSSLQMLVEVTGTATVTITGISETSNIVQPGVKYTAITSGTGTLSAGDMEGADLTVLKSSGQATPSFTTRTAAQIIAGIPNAAPGLTYVFRILNYNSGIATMVAGSGVAISGTATIAAGASTDYMVSIDSLSAVSLTNIGVGSTS